MEWADQAVRVYAGLPRHGSNGAIAREPARLRTVLTMEDVLQALVDTWPGRLRHLERVPDREAQFADWPGWLDGRLVDTWQGIGIERPYQHQASAADLAFHGRHVILATGTASGKSLAFQMAGLARLSNDPSASVLYLAPTKALAHDQFRSLEGPATQVGVRAGVIDGDADVDTRRWSRAHAQWLLTNPDWLHHSLLPSHQQWTRFLRGLRLIVVDEAHAYRGLFGAHVSMVLRRLLRLATRLGAEPSVLFASATLADPAALAGRFLGDAAPDIATVSEDASAAGMRLVALWEPLTTDDGFRPSAAHEATALLTELVRRRTRTLTFVRSRREAEIVARTVRTTFEEAGCSDLASTVAAYRGGYLPEERRALEDDLRRGRVLGMAATNALELGIDVSGLDAVISAGWPGTRASLWQQFGRAGRGQSAALAILVARDDPLDTYLMANPDAVFSAPIEANVFDPENVEVLRGHLCCAAAEFPLTAADAVTWFGPESVAVLEELHAQAVLRRRPDAWYWVDRSRASDLVDLRGSAGMPVQVVEGETGRLLGSVDAGAADRTVHTGAVYVHQGVSYLVDELDLASDVALVHEAAVPYTTHARTHSDLVIIRESEGARDGATTIAFGELLVTSQVIGFQRRRGGRVIGEQSLVLPRRDLRTKGLWWSIDESVCTRAGIDIAAIPGAAHAAEHAAIGLLPLYATCDRWDIGGLSTAMHPQTGAVTIFVYDGYPGGAGFARRGFEIWRRWLTATATLLDACGCRDGCPACIQSPKCGNGNSPLDKKAARVLLEELLRSS